MSMFTKFAALAVAGLTLAAALAPIDASALTPRHDQVNSGPGHARVATSGAGRTQTGQPNDRGYR